MTFRRDRRTLVIVRRVWVRLAALLLAGLAFIAAGCFGGGGTKAGGKSVKRITLAMETPDAPDADAEFFIQEVKRRTGGRIRIVESHSAYSSGDPHNELRLVRALRSRKVKMAYVTSRAWERAGVVSFRALQAPFLITNYQLLRRVATGPIGREMLSSLARVRLVGLGLVPNELRRPLGRRPFVSARDFRGARIRVVTSPTSVLAFRALGAIPVTNLTANQVGRGLVTGRLDGVESSTHFIESNGYTHQARYLPSNLALFPKAQTIVIGRQTFDRLSPDDQAALREAAVATVAHADPAGSERDEIHGLCKQGLHLVRATSADLASLRQVTTRVYVELEREPVTKRMIAGIERLKQEVSGSPAALRACPRAKNLPGSTTNLFGPAKNPFPEGTFQTIITRQDLRRENSQFPYPGTLTLIVKGGTWRGILTPRTPGQPDAGGRVIVRGDQVTFVLEFPPEAKGTRDVLKWSYFQDRLTFKVVDVEDAGARFGYTVHPYRKVK